MEEGGGVNYFLMSGHVLGHVKAISFGKKEAFFPRAIVSQRAGVGGFYLEATLLPKRPMNRIQRVFEFGRNKQKTSLFLITLTES